MSVKLFNQQICKVSWFSKTVSLTRTFDLTRVSSTCHVFALDYLICKRKNIEYDVFSAIDRRQK